MIQEVTKLYEPPDRPDLFIEQLDEGRVRSFVVVWMETTDIGGAARFARSTHDLDRPMMACFLQAIANGYCADLTFEAPP